MAIPDYETLMLPVLEAAAGGEVAIRECVSRIGNEIGLSEAERNQLLPGGKGTTLASRVGWARTYLAQSGSVATGVSS